VPKKASARSLPKHMASMLVYLHHAPVAMLTPPMVRLPGMPPGKVTNIPPNSSHLHIVHGSARLAFTSSRHMGLIGRVMAASSSCEVSLVMDVEIGMMPSTVAMRTSPPIGVQQFMPSGNEVAYLPSCRQFAA